MFKINCRRAVLFLCLGISLPATRLPAADTPAKLVTGLALISPCPALIAAAQSNNIPLEPIEPPAATDTITPGDSITALITLRKKSRQTQWLVYLEAAAPEPKTESTNKPAPLVLFTSTGNRMEFNSEPVNATVRTLGPFSENGSGKPLDKQARLTLDKGFLGIGFDQSTAAALRLRQTSVHGSFGVGYQPPGNAQVAESKKLADAAKLTFAEERAIAGSFPAMFSYFSLIQQTPGLEEIFFDIVDLPSVWSLIRHAGVKNFNLAFSHQQAAALTNAPLSLPGNPPVYSFPMGIDLDGHRSLDLTFFVTAPRPPLLACAGIVGLLAERPGDKETYLTLRVLSARRATGQRPP